MQVKVINNSKINDERTNNYKIKISISHDDVIETNNNLIEEDIKVINFEIGDKVKHKEENILGEIKFIGEETTTIVWEDNTRERIKSLDLYKHIELIDNIKFKTLDNSVSNVTTKAINVIEDDEIVDEKILDKPDIEKIKMQRKIDELENKVNVKKTEDIKEKITNELIDIAVMKGVIDKDDIEIESQKILVMDDAQFEEYKNYILEFDNEHEVTSKFESKDIRTEAEIMLDKIKCGGGKGIIGDFTKKTANNIQSFTNNDARSLGDIRDEKFTYNNQYDVPTFGDQFESILNAKLNNSTSNDSYKLNKTASDNNGLPGFENLQGLTKPLQINSKHSAATFPTNTGIKELINGLDWTIISKI